MCPFANQLIILTIYVFNCNQLKTFWRGRKRSLRESFSCKTLHLPRKIIYVHHWNQLRIIRLPFWRGCSLPYDCWGYMWSLGSKVWCWSAEGYWKITCWFPHSHFSPFEIFTFFEKKRVWGLRLPDLPKIHVGFPIHIFDFEKFMLVTEFTYTLEILGTNLEFWTLGAHWFYFE